MFDGVWNHFDILIYFDKFPIIFISYYFVSVNVPWSATGRSRNICVRSRNTNRMFPSPTVCSRIRHWLKACLIDLPVVQYRPMSSRNQVFLIPWGVVSYIFCPATPPRKCKLHIGVPLPEKPWLRGWGLHICICIYIYIYILILYHML